jgi:hypothetical protein
MTDLNHREISRRKRKDLFHNLILTLIETNACILTVVLILKMRGDNNNDDDDYEYIIRSIESIIQVVSITFGRNRYLQAGKVSIPYSRILVC